MADTSEPVDEASKSGPFRLGRLRSMGGDGLAMLIVSCAGIVATGGLSLLLCLGRVISTARRTRCVPDVDPAQSADDRIILVPGVCLGPDGTPGKDFVSRLMRAGALPGRRIIILGGATRAGVAITEAMAGRNWLVSRGVRTDRILCEESSRNTLENLRAARRHFAIEDGAPVVVSNRYHLARIDLLAGGLAIRPALCAAEERLTLSAEIALRLMLEAFFIHWYIVGKMLARLLRRRAMLARLS